MLERHRTFVQGNVADNEARVSCGSVYLRIVEMAANHLRQFNKAWIGHHVERARPRQRHVINGVDLEDGVIWPGRALIDHHTIGEEHGSRRRLSARS